MSTPFNPDAPTQEYPAQRRGPPIRKVAPAPRWVDTSGKEHPSYVEAYRASVRVKLIELLKGCRSDGWINPRCRDQDIADLIMGSLMVSWP